MDERVSPDCPAGDQRSAARTRSGGAWWCPRRPGRGDSTWRAPPCRAGGGTGHEKPGPRAPAPDGVESVESCHRPRCGGPADRSPGPPPPGTPDPWHRPASAVARPAASGPRLPREPPVSVPGRRQVPEPAPVPAGARTGVGRRVAEGTSGPSRRRNAVAAAVSVAADGEQGEPSGQTGATPARRSPVPLSRSSLRPALGNRARHERAPRRTVRRGNAAGGAGPGTSTPGRPGSAACRPCWFLPSSLEGATRSRARGIFDSPLGRAAPCATY
ncbi:hypothetical protein EES47_18390 [Streptomyces sp. ADI98-12]|nr:hypothetical protein EES47_18390 [Streptomyces sp. ADI98-12]